MNIFTAVKYCCILHGRVCAMPTSVTMLRFLLNYCLNQVNQSKSSNCSHFIDFFRNSAKVRAKRSFSKFHLKLFEASCFEEMTK